MFQAITNKLKTIIFATGLISAMAVFPEGAQQVRGGGWGFEAIPTYQKELPKTGAPYQTKFENDLARLKSFNDKFQPDILAAQKKLGFDPEAMNAELLAMTKGTDRARHMQRQKEFEAKYETQLIKLTQAAGIDVAVQRRQLISLLDLKNTPVDGGRTLGMVIGDDQRQMPTPAVTPMPRPGITPTPGPESTPTPPEPDVIERSYAAPFS